MRRHMRVFAALVLAAAFVVGGSSAAMAGMGMQIFIATPAGKTLTLDVASSDSIENVRQKIQDQTGFLPERQVLTYGGVPLLDGQTLVDYSIPKESTLVLLPITPLAFSTLTLPSFVLDAPSSAAVRTTGGFGVEVSYALTAGALPTGIALDPTTGDLTGTPLASGPWSFTITATAGGVTATQAFSGTIAPQLAATGVELAPALAAGMLLVLSGAEVLAARRAPRIRNPQAH